MKIQDLHRLFLSCHAVCTDTRTIKKDDIYFALKGENFNGNIYAENALSKGAKYVVIDEEKYKSSPSCIVVNNVLETLQELASYHRSYLNLPIVALTGSNGKTTTKELIHAVLLERYKTKATFGNLNNHIGVPLTLLSMDSKTEIGVVEMGANHLNEIAFLCAIAQPDYGYITNFGKAHLEGFGGVDGVIKGKSEMYDYLMAHHKTIFVNGNDSIQMEKTSGSNRIIFGDKANANIKVSFMDASPFVSCEYRDLVIRTKLVGDYNFNNIAAAIAIGDYFKVEPTAIKKAIENYRPTNNRSQIITRGTTKIILDAYNANPTSMTAALLNFNKQTGRKMAILGDMFELGKAAKEEHQSLMNLTCDLNVDAAVFIGENFYQSEAKSKKTEQYQTFEDFKKAFDFSQLENASLLIKGSRGMALERVLELF